MMTLDQILTATDGTLIHGRGGSRRFNGVSIDSRTLKRGNVFVAIRGKNLDGHRFIARAVRKGASLLVVSEKISGAADLPVILVKDTAVALGQIAGAYRRGFDIPVIAVTGSAGKTTTKDMIAAVLGSKFKVLKNERTLNNQYGVSLTVLGLKPCHDALVIELGTNNPGEIEWLAGIARPSVAVLTNIGESHLEGLKNRSGVYKEKSAIFRGIGAKGHVIFNNDDPYLRKIRGEKKRPGILTCGIERKSDLQARQIRVKNNRKTCFHVDGHGFILNTPAPDYVYNALAAIACGRLFGVSDREIKKALEKLAFGGHRQQVRAIGGVTIIDDTYNSNPVSVRNALKTLDALRAKGKKIFITADMLELGARSTPLHREKGRWIARSTTDVAITVGKFSRHAAGRIRQGNRSIDVFHHASIAGVPERLKKLCRPGDIVLVKGSRGMRMERVVEFLHRHLSKKF
ncbi:MAG TPA: UDP-N-acetylmuramoyl-tripeptide--D-alanyl-D-alanine ligase [Candidatus Omnitrophica bacterium]|nr:MAG: hypothetical protein A2Y05_05055 [Omnitrophica WOR_2 bacterium GWA2_53_43]HBO97137.1 UDP-N-acetylmuramoyl-tripeptide--D-alanyl-D-alanine ligase [Candidatus Omnitrophota bacterium]HCI45470.1 UDP-N-acetylmuramoyl-tripeptide--D-alanyl-D-alanine ligase [Candidatus Omnitrophota bacterium]